MSLYDDLGVTKDADAGKIRRAFKMLAQRLHPDRSGGDEEQFKKVQHAYDVLGDEDKRSRYDATGEDAPQQSRESRLSQMAAQVIATQIAFALANRSLLRSDIIKSAIEHCTSLSLGLQEEVTQHQGRAVLLEQAKSRATDPDGIFSNVIDGQIASLKMNIKSIRTQISDINDVVKIVEKISYRPDGADGSLGSSTSFVSPYMRGKL